MGYKGGSLTSLFGPVAQEATAVAARRMAERGGDKMVDVAVANTPIDSGNLRTSWYQLPTTKGMYRGAPSYTSGVATDVPYAPYVEHGTGLFGPKKAKYVIRPKNPGGMLSWVGPGGRVFAHEVMHPGSPGQHMVAIAGEVAEDVADDALYPPILDEWRQTIEGGAD